MSDAENKIEFFVPPLHPGDEITGLCRRCNERDATHYWDYTGDGRWGCAAWCEVCCLEVQIKYARERADALPQMESRLKELLDVESGK